MPFPVNRTIREAQGNWFQSQHAWRGNIVVAKFRDNSFKDMMNIAMADFPIVRIFFSTTERLLIFGR